MKTKLHSAVAFTSSDMDTIFELGSHMHLNEPISLCPFSNDSEEEFKCVVCFMLLHDPIQLECCGLNVCKRCMEMFANSEENTVCPRCRTSLFEWFEDKRIAKKITNLKMHCPLKCGWNGQFEDQQRHLETECDLACAKCNKCREIVRLKERNVHNKDRCKHVLCKCCSNNFPSRNSQDTNVPIKSSSVNSVAIRPSRDGTRTFTPRFARNDQSNVSCSTNADRRWRGNTNWHI